MQIKKNFDTILEEVHQKIEDERNLNEEERNLEEAIADIVDGKPSEENGDKVKDTEVAPPHPNDSEETDDMPPPEPLDGEEDDSPSVPIAESQMQIWINNLYRITPQK